MTDIDPRDLAKLIDALTRNGSDNPVTNHALVTCTEVIAANLAAICEQVRIANLIAVATAGAATPFIPRDIRDALGLLQEPRA
ncbi:hypothetical protein EII34_15005 [Arachnia propionica]|uniref:Uncharacterized protein n=1 Tax=Arachnia propionica TaxID=1750 RepID=A0A3P1T3Y8_9ACTN|nr:hypothetical protein [Arachnia propionica]RRD03213.1 hypothetical protein EII34_15005 [Arachnia propionica]